MTCAACVRLYGEEHASRAHANLASGRDGSKARHAEWHAKFATDGHVSGGGLLSKAASVFRLARYGVVVTTRTGWRMVSKFATAIYNLIKADLTTRAKLMQYSTRMVADASVRPFVAGVLQVNMPVREFISSLEEGTNARSKVKQMWTLHLRSVQRYWRSHKHFGGLTLKRLQAIAATVLVTGLLNTESSLLALPLIVMEVVPFVIWAVATLIQMLGTGFVSTGFALTLIPTTFARVAGILSSMMASVVLGGDSDIFDQIRRDLMDDSTER